MTASAATIIAQAGDTRQMSQNALYLIHRAWGLALGNRYDMQEMIGTLDKIDNRIAGLYARRANKEQAHFLELMDANDGGGRFLDAEEAKDFGLIDNHFEPMQAAASINREMLTAMGLSIPAGSKVSVTAKAEITQERKRKRALRKLKI